MNLYKNPHIFSIPIKDNHFLTINPLKNNAVRLLNSSQYKLLNLIDNADVLQYVSDNQNDESLNQFIEIIQEEEFVNSSNEFKYTQSLNSNSLSLWVHNTDSCNLRCKYCYIHTKDTNLHMHENVIETLCEKIIETVSEKNLKSVSLRISGGEPFLNYKLWDGYFTFLKDKLSEKNCHLRIVFLTNLTLINDRIIQFILKHNISIAGSIDGIGKYNNQTRIFKTGDGTFDVIDKNLKALVRAEITPSLMTVVSNGNITGLTEFTKYVIDTNLSTRYSIVQHDNFDYEKALPIFFECYKIFEKAIDNGYTFSRNHKLCDLHFISFYDRACSCGRNSGTIYVNGDIYFCQQQVGTSAKLGSIFSDENLLNTIITGDFNYGNISNDCLNCKYRYICGAGCPLSQVDGKSNSCNFYHKIIPEYYRLIGLERLRQITDIQKRNGE